MSFEDYYASQQEKRETLSDDITHFEEDIENGLKTEKFLAQGEALVLRYFSLVPLNIWRVTESRHYNETIREEHKPRMNEVRQTPLFDNVKEQERSMIKIRWEVYKYCGFPLTYSISTMEYISMNVYKFKSRGTQLQREAYTESVVKRFLEFMDLVTCQNVEIQIIDGYFNFEQIVVNWLKNQKFTLHIENLSRSCPARSQDQLRVWMPFALDYMLLSSFLNKRGASIS